MKYNYKFGWSIILLYLTPPLPSTATVKRECSSPPEAKRIRLLTYFSSEPHQQESLKASPSSPLDREIREYLHTPVSDENTNPLQYWRDNQNSLLGRLAGRLFSLPVVASPVRTHLERFGKRVESLEEASVQQTEEYLYLKVNKALW